MAVVVRHFTLQDLTLTATVYVAVSMTAFGLASTTMPAMHALLWTSGLIQQLLMCSALWYH